MKQSQAYEQSIIRKLKNSGLPEKELQIALNAVHPFKVRKSFSLTQANLKRIKQRLDFDHPVILRVSKTGKVIVWSVEGLKVRQDHARNIVEKAHEAARVARYGSSNKQLVAEVPRVSGMTAIQHE